MSLAEFITTKGPLTLFHICGRVRRLGRKLGSQRDCAALPAINWGLLSRSCQLFGSESSLGRSSSGLEATNGAKQYYLVLPPPSSLRPPQPIVLLLLYISLWVGGFVEETLLCVAG